MHFSKRRLLTGYMAAGLGLGLITPQLRAQAQSATSTSAAQNAPSPSSDNSWHVAVAPYLWFAGISGTVGADGHESSVHVNAGDVLSNLNIGIMGAMEARYNRILIPVDFMWVKLSDNKGIAFDEGAESVHTKLNEDIFTPKIGYRLVDRSRFKVDAMIGLRYWHLGTTLTLQPTELNQSFYSALNWVDAVEGGRFQVMLTPKVMVTVAGDAGGGGSKLDYQVVGLLGYKLKKVTLEAGWRYLAIHKEPTSGSFIDLAQTGVIVGAVIPLK